MVVAADGEQRIGRYGWKADIATLDEMVAERLRQRARHQQPARPAAAGTQPIEDDGSLVRAVAAYLRTLRPPSE